MGGPATVAVETTRYYPRKYHNTGMDMSWLYCFEIHNYMQSVLGNISLIVFCVLQFCFFLLPGYAGLSPCQPDGTFSPFLYGLLFWILFYLLIEIIKGKE